MPVIKATTLGVALLAIAAILTPYEQPAFAEQAGATTVTLYERLGSWEGIQRIVSDTIANHRKNPAISHYFADVDTATLAGHVTTITASVMPRKPKSRQSSNRCVPR